MFEKQYRFLGSHAEKVVALTSAIDEGSKAKFFDRNIDVYINAPMVGFLFKNKSTKDKLTKSEDIKPQNIFPEQMRDNSEELNYVFRLILLLDVEYEPDKEKRLNKAFRGLGSDDKDLELFDSYVLGGVDILYEKLIEGVKDNTEYISRLYDFVEDFNNKFNDEIANKDILDLCNKADL